MAEAISHQQPDVFFNGPNGPTDYLGGQNDVEGSAPRQSLISQEANKLPLSLCRKPNRATMQEQEYVDSIREMMENRIYLDDKERQAFRPIVN